MRKGVGSNQGQLLARTSVSPPGPSSSYLDGDEGLLIINVNEHIFPRTE